MELTTYFSDQEGALLLKLFIAHILADFLLQHQASIDSKSKNGIQSPSFWIHMSWVTLLSALAMLGHFNWFALFLIVLTHAIIDLLKLKIERNFDETKKEHLKKYSYIADQMLHVLFMLIAWLILIDGWPEFSALIHSLANNYNLLLILTGYLIVIGPTTYLIKYVTIRWNKEILLPENSLDDAGKTIGILERIIVLTLLLTSQYTAIGFLVTAKSILRLIDKPEYNKDRTAEQNTFSTRKHTEYVLIGTFLSLSIALLTGFVINLLLTV